jgi:hemolysin-activating ACP:hemolysin acyltransferase
VDDDDDDDDDDKCVKNEYQNSISMISEWMLLAADFCKLRKWVIQVYKTMMLPVIYVCETWSHSQGRI